MLTQTNLEKKNREEALVILTQVAGGFGSYDAIHYSQHALHVPKINFHSPFAEISVQMLNDPLKGIFIEFNNKMSGHRKVQGRLNQAEKKKVAKIKMSCCAS